MVVDGWVRFFKVHLEHGYDIAKGGYEYALTQLLIALALFLTGGGRLFARLAASQNVEKDVETGHFP